MRTGIYIIELKGTDKFYIGSAALNFAKRWAQHRSDLRKNSHKNIHLQRAWNKYGEESFEFRILEKCLPEDCSRIEQQYLDLYEPHFNISPSATTSLGIKRRPETLAKISASRTGVKLGPHSEETKRKIGNAHRGKVMSEEAKVKIRIARAKQIITDEHKAAISRANTGKVKSAEWRKNLSDSHKRRREVK